MAKKILNIICVILSVISVLLCGCNRQAPPDEGIVTSFTADFAAAYRGMRLGGTVTHLRQGVCTLDFTEPDTLDGLRVQYRGGTVSVGRENIAATADEPYLPAESFPALMKELLREAGREGLTAENGDTYSVPLSAGTATLTVDGSRLPRSATVDGAALTVSFLNGEALE